MSVVAKEPVLPFWDWSLLHVALVWIYEGVPQGPISRRPTDASKAWFVRRGRLAVSAGDVTVEAKAGDWLFAPRLLDERHQSDDLRLLSIRFRADWPDGRSFISNARPLILASSQRPALLRHSEALLRTVERIAGQADMKVLGSTCKLSNYLRVERLTAQWFQQYALAMFSLGERATEFRVVDERIERARAYIDRLPVNEKLDRVALARECGMGTSRLEELFCKIFDTTPRAYFEARRLRVAQDMLSAGQYSIKEIAYHLGLSSLAGFSHWFRKHTQESPRSYRLRKQ